MTETIKRIFELMIKTDDTVHSLEVNAKLPISSVHNWKNKKSKPSMDSIIKLARYFNVSADYLLCLSDVPTPLTKDDIIKRPDYALYVNLSKDQRFVNSAKLYNAMPNEFQSEVCTYIFGVAVGIGLNVRQILKK